MKTSDLKTNFVRNTGKIMHATTKNSPLILTGAGIVGLGLTGYLAFKSAKKVSDITDQVEETRDNGEELDKVKVGIDLGKAVALPIFVGLASVTAIGASYYIMNNRVASLAAALSTATAEHEYYRRKYREQYGEEELKEFEAPTHEEDTMVKDKNGKEKKQKTKVKEVSDSLYGEWFDHSSEYVSDDFSYNQEFIRSVSTRLQDKLFRRGFLLMNEVRDELGFERNRAGALVGYTTTDNFDIDQTIIQILDKETGELKPEIYVVFPKSHYIYDSVEYEDMFNPFGGWGKSKAGV